MAPHVRYLEFVPPHAQHEVVADLQHLQIPRNADAAETFAVGPEDQPPHRRADIVPVEFRPQWINRIAHRVCYDWQKSRVAREANTKRHAGEVLALDDAGAVLEDPSTLLDRREFMDDLRRALARLPERQGRTFTLVHVNGYGISETARIMKIRRATVRSNLRHAANKLRQLMEDYGV